MPVFYYKAVDQKGSIRYGVVTATDQLSGYDLLKMQTLQTIYLKEHKPQKARNLSLYDWKNLCDRLSKLSEYLALTESLEVLRSQEKSYKIQACILSCLSNLHDGDKLSQAFLKAFPNAPDTLLALLRHAENSGTYCVAFKEAAEYFTWRLSIKNQLQSQLRYPMIIAAFMTIMTFFFAHMVAPAFEPLFEGTQPKTLIFSALMYINSAQPSDIFILIGIFFILGLCIYFNPQFIKFIFKKMPFTKNRLNSKDIISLSKELHVRLSAGISLRQSLLNIKKNTSSYSTDKIITQIVHDLDSGKSFSQSIQETSAFPDLFTQLIKMAEKTASLETHIKLFNEIMTKSYEQKINKILSIIHPLALIILGGFMIWLVVGLITPLYDALVKIH